MSIVRSLDVQGDWTFGQGINNYLTYNDQIAQDIQTRLLSFLGNCFFDIAAGIDWFNLIGGKSVDAITLAVRTIILNTQYVTGVQDLSVSFDNTRALSISYTAYTVYNGTIQNTVGLILTQDGSILTTQDGVNLHA